MDNISNYQIINAMYAAIPFISQLFKDNICLGIADKEKYLYVKQGCYFHVPFATNDPLNNFASKCIEKGETCSVSFPKDLISTDNCCYLFPLFENGEAIGIFTAAVDLSSQNKLVSSIETLTSAISNIYSNTKEVSEGAEKLASENEHLLKATNIATEKAKKSNSIVSMIEDISMQTNLLGMNASIEAARAGDAGRGFAVVATEISRLSSTTKDSIDQIGNIVSGIHNEIKHINNGISEINDVSQNQTTSLQQIVAALEKIDETVKELNELSKRI